MAYPYVWPSPIPNVRLRPPFLEAYPVPPGKTFNINSFLGRFETHGGKFLVPQASYGAFLESYVEALEAGYQMFLTENYHQQVYKYFVELDWEWDTDLGLVMEVTPQLIALIASVAGEFYTLPYPNYITSIRTPFKVHLNFPQLLTTELLACVCRDRILEACRSKLSSYDVDWERLIDFPHGSLRLMGSRKGTHMDSDPAWVRDKAYHPAKLVDGKWRPGRMSPPLLSAASIFPAPYQVAAFERSPRYLDMVFSDMAAYKQKLEERRRRRAEAREAGGGPAAPPRNLPPGSGRLPLIVTLDVRPDDTVGVQIYIKSKFRTKGQQAFGGGAKARRGNPPVVDPREAPASVEAAPEASAAASGMSAAAAATAAVEAAAVEAAGTAGTAPAADDPGQHTVGGGQPEEGIAAGPAADPGGGAGGGGLGLHGGATYAAAAP
ncbi:hypothetical protein GPECTOR_25g403 [Gonium pectorale]|uniref:C962R-like N-terminal AEP domain-containing protein n=1 Tax=Gonium pectorale TaxID=33097 RepID=A0A150GG54_GONPE|nr:hypothetical protein GPECTOR_25g403 [Gonium pectorale]|eukprot:KXZ48818.1 hypothetical protein GPECTOR_25g403 [Gonium pectorale]